MIKEVITAKTAFGTIQAPPSKAHTLRAIIIASLAKGKTIIKNGLIAEDQEYAMKAMEQFGAKIRVDKTKNEIEITGVNGKPLAPKENVFVGNSGLTIRFLVSIAGLAKGNEYVVLDGIERMRTGRPIQDLLDALKPLGVEAISLNGNGCPPIKVKSDSFIGGKTSLAGDKSSQYFSSILVASPYAKQDVEIKTIGHLSSKPYIDVTIQSMKDFGVTATNTNYENFNIKSGQEYIGKEINIEGDYSNAAYFFAAAAILGGKVKVTNLPKESKQGDKFFITALEKMGCKVTKGEDFVELSCNSPLKGIGDVDMNDYPDIVMPLAVVSAFANGKTRITNIAHLKFKESDRLSVTVEELKKMGANATCDDDSLTVIGENGKNLHGAEIDSHNDHRIAMSFTVAGLKVNGVKIINSEAVNKSFPEFYEEIEKILNRTNEKKNLFLIGYRGTGKSTLGKQIASKENKKFIEIDDLIIQEAGKSVPQIFAQDGEAKFRDYEHQILKKICESDEQIVSCGGGIITNEENIKLMKQNGTVCLLKADTESIYHRIYADSNRPALTDKDPKEEIKFMLKKRNEAYEKAKDFEVSTCNKKICDCVSEITSKLKDIKTQKIK
ncbi:MAG: 3-phosphoshikimate 1-carboxyvinyltransferase [archaeon]|jgi:3-phosphoshikimate 1-carboxyvinyltransferase